MDEEPESRERRRQVEIRRRIDGIRTRIDALQTTDRQNMTAATPSERIASANRHLAAAQAAAQEAVAASIHAFRWAAEAHERVARQHERAAAAGTGDNDEHKRLAAVHWAAAAEDRQRAKRGQLLLGDEETDDARGPDADQALTGLSTSQLGALQPQPRGGHFVAWEEPEAFATEVRAAFKPLR